MFDNTPSYSNDSAVNSARARAAAAVAVLAMMDARPDIDWLELERVSPGANWRMAANPGRINWDVVPRKGAVDAAPRSKRARRE